LNPFEPSKAGVNVSSRTPCRSIAFADWPADLYVGLSGDNCNTAPFLNTEYWPNTL
jgi:hypothetical protein